MRPRFGPPPTREQLLHLPIHEIVRDWPESLAVLERAGVSVAAHGDVSISQVPHATETVLRAVDDVTSWRRIEAT